MTKRERRPETRKNTKPAEPETVPRTSKDYDDAEHRYSDTPPTPEPQPEPANEPDTTLTSPPTGDQQTTTTTGRTLTIYGNGQAQTQDYPPAAPDPAIASRIESLERTVQNLIQIVEAGSRVQQLPDAGNGWQGALQQGLGLLNNLFRPEGQTDANGLASQFMTQMMNTMFGHYQVLDGVLAKQYGLPTPIPHMTMKQ